MGTKGMVVVLLLVSRSGWSGEYSAAWFKEPEQGIVLIIPMSRKIHGMISGCPDMTRGQKKAKAPFFTINPPAWSHCLAG